MGAFGRIAARKVEFGLLVAATLIIGLTLMSLNLALGVGLNSDLLWVIGGFIGVFTIAHLALCLFAPQADQIMLPVQHCLMAWAYP